MSMFNTLYLICICIYIYFHVIQFFFNLTYRIFHFVFGIEHVSTYPILVNRICEGLQHCIAPKNFLITMHSKEKNVYTIPKYNETTALLNSLGIDFHMDHRMFTSNNKMMISLDQLYGIYRKNSYIYHTGMYYIYIYILLYCYSLLYVFCM